MRESPLRVGDLGVRVAERRADLLAGRLALFPAVQRREERLEIAEADRFDRCVPPAAPPTIAPRPLAIASKPLAASLAAWPLHLPACSSRLAWLPWRRLRSAWPPPPPASAVRTRRTLTTRDCREQQTPQRAFHGRPPSESISSESRPPPTHGLPTLPASDAGQSSRPCAFDANARCAGPGPPTASTGPEAASRR